MEKDIERLKTLAGVRSTDYKLYISEHKKPEIIYRPNAAYILAKIVMWLMAVSFIFSLFLLLIAASADSDIAGYSGLTVMTIDIGLFFLWLFFENRSAINKTIER